MLSEKNLSVIPLTSDEEFLHNNLISLMLFYQSKESTQFILKAIKSAKGSFVNYCKNYTFLNTAIFTQNSTIVNALLAHPEIDVNVKSSFNRNMTALHTAAFKNNIHAIDRLLNFSKIEINAQDYYGNTALHIAGYRNNVKITTKLLKHPDIEINIQNKNGNTALHIFTRIGSFEGIKLLLKHPKIDCYLLNNEDQIVGDYFAPYVLPDQKRKIIHLLEVFKEQHPPQKILETPSDDIDLNHSFEDLTPELTGLDHSVVDID